jgi:uncharacterized protein YbjQ (UPF0145 family)
MQRNHFKSRLARTGLVLAVLTAAGAVHARNDKLMLPISPALRSPGTVQLLGPDVQLRFGRATTAGAEVINPQIEVHGVGDPFVSTNTGYGRRERRTDEQVCLDAFRKAVVELQKRARSFGASAVVGIVSNYNRVEMDSGDLYECHVGYTRAVVDFKGQAARVPVGQQPQPQAAAVVPLIATGFANINDIDAIPYLSDKGREAYREYLGRPTPKAFALSPSGNWFSAWTLVPGEAGMPTDPVERAVLACNRNSSTPCKLYAVNGAVVWTKP